MRCCVGLGRVGLARWVGLQVVTGHQKNDTRPPMEFQPTPRRRPPCPARLARAKVCLSNRHHRATRAHRAHCAHPDLPHLRSFVRLVHLAAAFARRLLRPSPPFATSGFPAGQDQLAPHHLSPTIVIPEHDFPRRLEGSPVRATVVYREGRSFDEERSVVEVDVIVAAEKVH